MREIAEKILKKYYKRNNGLILDAGCGLAYNSNFLSLFGKVVSLDKSNKALKIALKKEVVNLICADTQKLPFKNESFDLVTSFDVLYHEWVSNPKEVINEYFRLLKPGGHLFLRLPAFNFLKRGHDNLVMTKRRFTVDGVKKMLPVNSKVAKATYVNMLLFPIVILRKFSIDTDFKPMPKWLNKLLEKILAIESGIIEKFNLPFGSSIYVLVRKD